MSWKTHYAEHTMPVEEAIKRIHSGDRVVTGHACGEPPHLLDAKGAPADH